MLVDSFLEATARRLPDKVGLVAGARRLTYGELDSAGNALAVAFRSLGLARGDRVVIHLENSVEGVVSIFGTLKADGVFVLINPTVKPEKLAYVLNDSGATVLVSDQRPAVVAEALREVPGLRAVVLVGDSGPADALHAEGRRVETFQDLLDANRGVPAPRPRGIDVDVAALIYTSGSTGVPKGVTLTHANITSAADSISSYLEITEADVILDALPLSFDYGMYQVLLAFQAGARLILERAFVYPSTVLHLIVCERVTGLPLVPMMAALLLRQDLSAYDLSSLRYLTNTGAVLPTEHVMALRERLPHVKIFKMYGLTECKRVSYLDPADIDRRPDSVGRPMDNVEVYLVDEQGVRLESGLGELVVRGSNIMQGYWRSPEDTARALKPGPYPGEFVLHTGDRFRIDEEGYMYFLSRTDDVIKSRGQKVSPREVEAVLHRLPGVQEAFVTGVRDAVLGEAVKAFVTLDGSRSLSEQDLLWHCAKHLEDFMVPKSVEIVDTLPRTSAGKVARQQLQPSE